jgi:hypothetical protein
MKKRLNSIENIEAFFVFLNVLDDSKGNHPWLERIYVSKRSRMLLYGVLMAIYPELLR